MLAAYSDIPYSLEYYDDTLLDFDGVDFDMFTDEGNETEWDSADSTVSCAQSSAKLCTSKRSVPHKSRVTMATKLKRLVGKGGAKPNMSRRRPDSVLYSFPSFDKCDSLLFLPSTLVSFLNSNDMAAAGQLLTTRLSSNCEIKMSFCDSIKALDANSLVRLHTILNETQPDRIMCVHSTKVVENQIRATIHMKGTENKLIHDSVINAVRDPVLDPLVKMSHKDMLKMKIDTCPYRHQNDDAMYSLIELEQDLVVYVYMEMVLTINDRTRKVSHFEISGWITSIQPV